MNSRPYLEKIIRNHLLFKQNIMLFALFVILEIASPVRDSYAFLNRNSEGSPKFDVFQKNKLIKKRPMNTDER